MVLAWANHHAATGGRVSSSDSDAASNLPVRAAWVLNIIMGVASRYGLLWWMPYYVKTEFCLSMGRFATDGVGGCNSWCGGYHQDIYIYIQWTFPLHSLNGSHHTTLATQGAVLDRRPVPAVCLAKTKKANRTNVYPRTGGQVVMLPCWDGATNCTQKMSLANQAYGNTM